MHFAMAAFTKTNDGFLPILAARNNAMTLSCFLHEADLAVIKWDVASRFWVAKGFRVATFATMLGTPSSVSCFAASFLAFFFCEIHAGVVVTLA